jgi:alpha-tubulin suppressor-like RCC1 family protein
VAFRNLTTFAWGANNYYELGNGDSDGASKNVPVPVTGSAATGMTGVSAGGSHTLAFNSAPGEVFAWGNNYYGELGNALNTISVTPVQVYIDAIGTHLTGVTAVSAGMIHSLALDSSNHVWAWGDNTYGQLGVALTTTSLNYAATVPISNIIKIAAGSYHNLALTGSNTVLSWGHNGLGQLGYTTTSTISPTPTLVMKAAVGSVPSATLSNVSEIAAGNTHSLFLIGGTVWACGYNKYGELGDGTTIDRINGAVQVQGLTGVAHIAAGLDHSLALINGEVWAWGLNFNGQLGNGLPLNSMDANSTPTRVKTNSTTYLSGVKKIVAIGNHSLALKNDGTLWAWGENTYSQLGLGTSDTTDRNYATQVTTSTGYDLYIH